MAIQNQKPHLAVVASPGLGHVIPLLEMAKRIRTIDDVEVTIYITTAEPSTAHIHLFESQNLPENFHVVELPPPDTSALISADSAVVTRICVVVKESIPALRSAIFAVTSLPTLLIVDFFCTDAFEIADELNIPKLIYMTSSAAFLALTMYTPVLDKEIHGEYVDQPEPIQIPGCNPIRPEDVVDPMLDRTDEQYSWYVRTGARFPLADGIMVNTWEDMEHTSLNALRHEKKLRQIMPLPIYPVGPFISGSSSGSGSELQCLDWLDAQPIDSVLYVSFGSGGTLSLEQLTELAWGLELSRQRFLWIIRCPNRDTEENDGTYFTTGNGGGDDPSEYLPDGFLTRTKGVGLVISKWGPQVEILGHPSTGGFLTHCGWNSVLESIMNGVPMIAWPLYAEQRMNASALTEEFGIAVRPKILPTKKVVGREEIEKMVRKVMEEKEGSIIREKVKQLKSSALKALDKDGSSYHSLSQLFRQCK